MWFLMTGCIDYGLGDPDDTVIADLPVTESFTQAPLPGLDVLFVVDNTGSMVEEQAGLAGAAAPFVSGLDALQVDYHLGVTTTDPKDAGALTGRPWIITPEADDPAAALAAALVVGTDATPPGAGLDAAVMAVADASGGNHGFRRPDAALHVIFVSDDDDESGEVLGEDPANGFLAWLGGEAADTGRVARASAVVGDIPSGCRGTGGSALPGTRYAEVAVASGGEVVSICASDFAVVAEAIDEVAIEWPVRFTLQAAPVAGSAVVSVNGVRATSGWFVDAVEPALVFEVPPAGDAEITITYSLAGS